jgi:hypothetical protein
VSVVPAPSGEFDLVVEVCSTLANSFLPQGLQLSIVDESDLALMQAVAKNSKSMVLQFSSEPGERFKVEILWESYHIVEMFAT